jgi:hypothetical protein
MPRTNTLAYFDGATPLSIKGLYVTLSIKMFFHFAECRLLLTVMLNVVMLNVSLTQKRFITLASDTSVRFQVLIGILKFKF